METQELLMRLLNRVSNAFGRLRVNVPASLPWWNWLVLIRMQEPRRHGFLWW